MALPRLGEARSVSTVSRRFDGPNNPAKYLDPNAGVPVDHEFTPGPDGLPIYTPKCTASMPAVLGAPYELAFEAIGKSIIRDAIRKAKESGCVSSEAIAYEACRNLALPATPNVLGFIEREVVASTDQPYREIATAILPKLDLSEPTPTDLPALKWSEFEEAARKIGQNAANQSGIDPFAKAFGLDAVKDVMDKYDEKRQSGCESGRIANTAPNVEELDRVPCTLPPAGWHCTRKAGHSGPCAAWPDDFDSIMRGDAIPTPQPETIVTDFVTDRVPVQANRGVFVTSGGLGTDGPVTGATQITYPCGCSATGGPGLPSYCSEHQNPDGTANGAAMPTEVRLRINGSLQAQINADLDTAFKEQKTVLDTLLAKLPKTPRNPFVRFWRWLRQKGEIEDLQLLLREQYRATVETNNALASTQKELAVYIKRYGDQCSLTHKIEEELKQETIRANQNQDKIDQLNRALDIAAKEQMQIKFLLSQAPVHNAPETMFQFERAITKYAYINPATLAQITKILSYDGGVVQLPTRPTKWLVSKFMPISGVIYSPNPIPGFKLPEEKQ